MIGGLSGPPGLQVSVRSAAEAESALAGGADLIDVKEPSRGPLGAADAAVIRDVITAVAGRRPVSAALAGSLDEPAIRRLAPLGPDWFAVRGAACVGGRGGTVCADRVRRMKAVIAESATTRAS